MSLIWTIYLLCIFLITKEWHSCMCSTDMSSFTQVLCRYISMSIGTFKSMHLLYINISINWLDDFCRMPMIPVSALLDIIYTDTNFLVTSYKWNIAQSVIDSSLQSSLKLSNGTVFVLILLSCLTLSTSSSSCKCALDWKCKVAGF